MTSPEMFEIRKPFQPDTPDETGYLHKMLDKGISAYGNKSNVAASIKG
jgi:hypothetical protein